MQTCYHCINYLVYLQTNTVYGGAPEVAKKSLSSILQTKVEAHASVLIKSVKEFKQNYALHARRKR